MGMAMVQYSLIMGVEKSTASNLLLVGVKVPRNKVVLAFTPPGYKPIWPERFVN